MIKKKLDVHSGFRSLVTDFFTDQDVLDLTQEWESFKSLSSKEEFKFFSNNLNGFFFIFNYRNGIYEYVSESVESYLGFKPNTFKELEGAHKLYDIIAEEHASIFVAHILKDVLEFLAGNVISDTGLDYRFSCGLKLRNCKNEYQWYLLDTVVLQTEANGLPWRTLLTITNIDQFKKDDHIYYNVLKKDECGIYTVVFEKTISKNENSMLLTTRENEIISFIAKGFQNKQIAWHLNICVDTVKTHRKNILSKTKCRGTAELTNFAFSRGLI